MECALIRKAKGKNKLSDIRRLSVILSLSSVCMYFYDHVCVQTNGETPKIGRVYIER
jgi:hypothetical protein